MNCSRISLLQNINKAGHIIQFHHCSKQQRPAFSSFCASTFVFQERSFNRNRTDLQVRLQQSGFRGLISTVYRNSGGKSIINPWLLLPVTDTVPVNLISEEALTAYVRENCGYNASDIKTLKKTAYPGRSFRLIY